LLCLSSHSPVFSGVTYQHRDGQGKVDLGGWLMVTHQDGLPTWKMAVTQWQFHY